MFIIDEFEEMCQIYCHFFPIFFLHDLVFISWSDSPLAPFDDFLRHTQECSFVLVDLLRLIGSRWLNAFGLLWIFTPGCRRAQFGKCAMERAVEALEDSPLTISPPGRLAPFLHYSPAGQLASWNTGLMTNSPLERLAPPPWRQAYSRVVNCRKRLLRVK